MHCFPAILTAEWSSDTSLPCILDLDYACAGTNGDLCPTQESKLAVLWTVGIFALNFGPVFVGPILDWVGPKLTTTLGKLCPSGRGCICSPSLSGISMVYIVKPEYLASSAAVHDVNTCATAQLSVIATLSKGRALQTSLSCYHNASSASHAAVLWHTYSVASNNLCNQSAPPTPALLMHLLHSILSKYRTSLTVCHEAVQPLQLACTLPGGGGGAPPPRPRRGRPPRRRRA